MVKGTNGCKVEKAPADKDASLSAAIIGTPSGHFDLEDTG